MARVTNLKAVSGETPADETGKTAIKTERGTVIHLGEAIKLERAQMIEAKAKIKADAKQKLAHAKDLYDEGSAKDSEATEIVQDAAFLLYKGRTEELLSPAEVSSALGDVFGYKMKEGTNQPGKTPAGKGEDIRKRVVRAASAYDHVYNGNGGAFFEGLPAEEIEPILTELSEGSMSIWTAYGKFADVKKEHTTRTNIAFDVKRLSTLLETLSEPSSAEIIRADESLIAVYATLQEIVDSILTVEVEKEAKQA